MKSKTSAIVVLVIGAVILLLSVFAGNIGLADLPALSPAQSIGAIVGIVVILIGASLRPKSNPAGGQEPQGESGAEWLDSLTKADEVTSTQVVDKEGQ